MKRKPLYEIHYVFGEGIYKDMGKGTLIAYTEEEMKEYVERLARDSSKRLVRIEEC